MDTDDLGTIDVTATTREPNDAEVRAAYRSPRTTWPYVIAGDDPALTDPDYDPDPEATAQEAEREAEREAKRTRSAEPMEVVA